MRQTVIVDGDWPHIDPGKKRHTIAIHGAGTSRDAAGGISPKLGDAILTRRAAIDTFTGRELFQEGFVSQVIHKISIDWPRKVRVTTDMQVVVHPAKGAQANLYQIQTIENVQERNLVMILTCVEIDNALVGS